MTQFVNLLDRNITLIHTDGTIEELPASSTPAKPTTIDTDSEFSGIPVLSRIITTEQVTNLPPPVEGVAYLIPAPLGWMIRNRTDVYIPMFEMDVETKRPVTRKLARHIFG